MTTHAETISDEHFLSISPLPTAVPPPLPAGMERREATRVELFVGVGFLSDTNFYTGFTADISEGGMFVATHMLQPIGSRITVTFALPNGSEMTVRCAVRWLRDPALFDAAAPPGMGVQFLSLRPADHDAICSFIRRTEPSLYQA